MKSPTGTWEEFEDPRVEHIQDLFTVEMIVNYLDAGL